MVFRGHVWCFLTDTSFNRDVLCDLQDTIGIPPTKIPMVTHAVDTFGNVTPHHLCEGARHTDLATVIAGAPLRSLASRTQFPE